MHFDAYQSQHQTKGQGAVKSSKVLQDLITDNNASVDEAYTYSVG